MPSPRSLKLSSTHRCPDKAGDWSVFLSSHLTEESMPALAHNSTRMTPLTEDVITKASPWSVADTVARVLAVARARLLTVVDVIDHTAAARALGRDLRETRVVVLGNPGTDARVIDVAPLSALDVPLKLVVWTDGFRTKLSYPAPEALAARYGLSDDLAEALSMIATVATAVVDR
jgi:uncharacterized protein (DUF302 family)